MMGLVKKVVERIRSEEQRAKRGSMFNVATDAFFKQKIYLQCKDLSHLLVFESKSSDIHFKASLHASTLSGNFVSVSTAPTFHSNAKRTTKFCSQIFRFPNPNPALHLDSNREKSDVQSGNKPRRSCKGVWQQ